MKTSSIQYLITYCKGIPDESDGEPTLLEIANEAQKELDNILSQVEPVVILQKVKCKCGKEFDELPLHTCPYQEDVNNDSEFTCNCCDECRQECCDDI